MKNSIIKEGIKEGEKDNCGSREHKGMDRIECAIDSVFREGADMPEPRWSVASAVAEIKEIIRAKEKKAFEAGVAEGKREQAKSDEAVANTIIDLRDRLDIPQALATYKQQLIGRWNKRIEEVKQGLDEEYGKGHNYTPNYEGIFIDLIQE